MYLKRVASLGGTQVEYTKYREKLYLVTKVSFLTFFFFFFFWVYVNLLCIEIYGFEDGLEEAGASADLYSIPSA